MEENMKDTFHIDREDAIMAYDYEVITDDFSRAGEASSDIKKKLRQVGIENDIIRRIAISTYEAEINQVIHSLGGRITLLIRPDRIELFFVDRGPGIENIELAMKEGFSTASNKVREMGFGAGMGLPNIKRCSDEFYIESEVGSFTKLKIVINL
jgi:serine/threonine-protein kinase RsbT